MTNPAGEGVDSAVWTWSKSTVFQPLIDPMQDWGSDKTVGDGVCATCGVRRGLHHIGDLACPNPGYFGRRTMADQQQLALDGLKAATPTAAKAMEGAFAALTGANAHAGMRVEKITVYDAADPSAPINLLNDPKAPVPATWGKDRKVVRAGIVERDGRLVYALAGDQLQDVDKAVTLAVALRAGTVTRSANGVSFTPRGAGATQTWVENGDNLVSEHLEAQMPEAEINADGYVTARGVINHNGIPRTVNVGDRLIEDVIGLDVVPAAKESQHATPGSVTTDLVKPADIPAIRRFLAERTAPWMRTGNWERKYELLHGRYLEMLPLFESLLEVNERGALDTIVGLHQQLQAARSSSDRRSAGAYNAVESQRELVVARDRTIARLQQQISELRRDAQSADNEKLVTRAAHCAQIQDLMAQLEPEKVERPNIFARAWRGYWGPK